MAQVVTQQAHAALDEAALRAGLIDRQQRLQSALSAGDSARLAELLNQVDAALQRLEQGTFGHCTVCDAEIEPERLLADPLRTVCLSCLGEQEQRQLERDLELAAEIQAALLPQPNLSHQGWQCHYRYQPHGTVSGDYCDLLPRQREILLLLGDVSGKGVSAGLLMSHLHAAFRSMAASQATLVDMVERANRLFCEATLARSFATLVAARLEPGGRVELANAGHCPVLLARDGRVEQLPGTGLPLGLFCSAAYTSHTIDLLPGDCLLLYTDGVSESLDPGGGEYGVASLQRLLAAHSHSSAPEITRAVVDDVHRHRAGQPAGDDLTVLSVRREPQEM